MSNLYPSNLLDDEPLEYAVLHRHLADPVYRIRRFGLMLTDDELFISLGIALGFWMFIAVLGWGQWAPFGGELFTLDPVGVLGVLALMLWGISFLHFARPESNFGTFLRAGGVPHSFAPSISDHRWKPSPVRERLRRQYLTKEAHAGWMK